MDRMKKNEKSSSGTVHISLWADLRENMGRSFGTQNLLFLLPRIEILGYDMGRGAASFFDLKPYFIKGSRCRFYNELSRKPQIFDSRARD